MIYTIIDDETNEIITEYNNGSIVMVRGESILSSFDIVHKEYNKAQTKIWVRKK